jgi:BirA family biotin operon repressor/biotin-[acetyl-CoA-carboxylase] ligase
MADAFLDAEQIRATTFARHVEIHDTLGSTNDRALELARDSTIEVPALVAARRQTAGRGRSSNKWYAGEGALTFSVMLDPFAIGISTASWPQLSLSTAVAVCDALHREAPNAVPAVKWPNDVLLDGGKVCGILIESPGGASPAKDRLVVGIGINVSNSWRTAPHSFGQSPTALCDVTETRHGLQTVLIRTLQALHARLIQLAGGHSQLPEDWQRLNWLTGQKVAVNASDRFVEGLCRGIDPHGALMIETTAGIHRIHSGSVRAL